MTIAVRALPFAAAVVSMATVAHAEITVTHAQYAAGVLVVRGETSTPNQRVTLDGRYDTRTDRNKRFVFRLRYLPRECGVTIRAGQEVRPARVANCSPIATPRPSPLRGGTSDDSVRDAVPARPFALRVVRQACETGQDCRVTCGEEEIALNAYCPAGPARLTGEREVSCGSGEQQRMIAYCASPVAPPGN